MVEHLACKLFKDGLCFHVEVPKHGGAFPATKEANVVAVDAAAKQGHGASGLSRASRQVCGVNTGVMTEGAGGMSCLAGDVGGTEGELMASVIVM